MNVRDKRPWQRALSLLLCLAMLLSFVPVTALAVEEESAELENTEILSAEETAVDTADADEGSPEETDAGASAQADEPEYVSLPVTIRDFAADGMLFEFNQTGIISGNYTAYKVYDYLTASAQSGFAWGTNNNLGFRVRPYSVYGDKLPDANEYWYCIICENNGRIVKILPSGKETKVGHYEEYMQEGRFSVWLWIADGTTDAHAAQREIYNELVELVNEKTQHNFRFSYDSNGKLSLKAEYATIGGKNYFLGDNNGFTLLSTNDNQYVHNLTGDGSIPGTDWVSNTSSNDLVEPDPMTVTLNSSAKQYVYGANLRLNLLEARLDEDGKPVYTQATVDYLADLLYTMLRVPYSVQVGSETFYTAYYLLGTKLYDENYNYVGKHSADAKYDLADVFRGHIYGGMGTYADAKAKFEAGGLSVPQDVYTYYDAAYYLLHNVWRDSENEGYNGDDGYGWNTWEYNKINLVQTTNEAGQKCYVFNSGYDGTKYDYMKVVDGKTVGSGAIYNTQVETMTPAKNKPKDDNGNYIGTDVYMNGLVLPNERFDPLGTSGAGASFGYGMNAGTYCDLLSSFPDRGELFYPTTNYHLTLEGHAKFIYYKDAAQYFTFTGDDDVYLYINGVRVLDLGGAHSIAKVRINMNDIAELCGLKDGNTYTFDFFYMERHGTAANFGIETNIQIVDPSMLTTKTGYQDGENTGYNGFVDPEKPVTYEFALANNGDADIENLTFDDKTIGVKLTKDEIVLNKLTSIEDLSVTVYDANGSSYTDHALTEDSLKGYLERGIVKNGKIVLHGFNYLIQDDDWACRYVDENKNGIFDEGDDRTSNWYFFNVIYTTATAEGENSTTRELTGTSNWVVQKEGEGGPVTDKTVAGTNDPNEFELTLEAYALGQTQTVTEEKAKPTDIVLVLDQSASMFSPAGGANDYTNAQKYDTDKKLTAAAILADKENAAHLGYYVAQSHGGRPSHDLDANGNEITYYDWFIVQYDAQENVWYYVRASHTAEAVNLDKSVAVNAATTGVIGETIKRSEPFGDDYKFVYYKSQYGALYDSINGFVDGLRDTEVDHRVAVVGFASPFYDGWVNYDGTGIYLDGEYYLYDTDYKYRDEKGIYSPDIFYAPATDGQKVYLDQSKLNFRNVSEVYDKALVDVSTAAGYASVKASVSAVTSNYRHTCPAAGLEIANKIFAATPAGGRDRVVILFTDGVPTVTTQADYNNAYDYSYGRDAYWNIAQGKNQAMQKAYETKHTYGARVYAVGTAAVEGDPFLNGISSDYPDANRYPTHDANGNYYRDEDTVPVGEVYAALGASIPNPKYTHFTNEKIVLTDIFNKILQSTTTVSVGADENSVLREVLTDYFVLQNNSKVDVDVYTAVYNGDGTYAEAEKREDLTVTLSSSDGTDRLDTIDVTGYDYRDEYISSVVRYRDGQPYYGSKLILKVRIKTRDGFWGGNNVPTNEPTTGIYDEQGNELSEFPEPQVNVPLSLSITAKDAVVYYGSDDLDAGLVDAITAGGLGVTIGEDGSLLPQADWMNDYAQLNWTEGMTKPGDDLSSTADGSYTYGVTLTPIYDGKENNSENPSNMAGTPVELTGMSAEDDANVEILVPVVYFQDSTLQQGEKPDADYFRDHNLVEGVQWVLMEDPDSTKAATHGSAPELSFTYHHAGIFTEATPVNVTVKGTYGTNEPIEMTEVSYFDWKKCTNTDLHDEGTIDRHLGGTAGQNEFWIHVPEGVGVGGLATDKYVEATDDPNEFVLTLEAYSVGQQTTFTKPADIVLVLDHSGSMRTPAGASKVLWSKSDTRAGDPYDGTEPTINIKDMDPELGSHRGYYVAWSTSSQSWFVMEYSENGKWLSYKVPSTESIIDTGKNDKGEPNWTEHTLTQEDTLTSNTYKNLIFYKSQYAVLYDALLEFVADLRESGVEHNVSIVGFAGSQTQGSRLYVGGDEDMVKTYDAMYNKATEARRTKLYQKAPKNVQDTAEYAELLKVIESIETNFSYTCPTAGLQMASDLFQANAVSLADRDRIVVLFTDGIPNRKLGEDTEIVEEDGRQNAIYDEIVKKAYETKSTYGAQVYSICTTTLKAGENGENRTFLNYASSNYPNAAAYSNPSSAASNQYYHEIKDFETLRNVFKTVTQSTTSVTLDEQAALKEVLTDYFVLNPDDTVDVEIYTAAYNGDGTFAEPELRTEEDGYKYTLSSSSNDGRNDTIEVTGFDYQDEYISNIARTVNGQPYYGSKLVVKVRIATRNGFWGGNNVPTNEDSTAIYNPEGKPVIGFPEPEVNVPADVEVIAKDKTVYYGDEPTAKELLDKVTAGGVEVTINDDGTFTPKEDWMDDFSDLSWSEPSTKPGDDASGTTPGDYTFEVVLKPNAPATDNTNDPGNIAGAPVDPAGKTDSDTGHVFVKVPVVTFEDSVTELGTPTDGYDYKTNDYVSTEWVFMPDSEDTAGAPEPGKAPDLTLTYTPEDGVTEFIGDTKVEVTVSRTDGKGEDIDTVTDFKWNDCEHPDEHGGCGAIGEHKANAENVHEFWVHTPISILPDTVVIDFGLPVEIDPLTNDLYGYEVAKTLNGIGDDFAESYNGTFGSAKVLEGDQLVRYAQNQADVLNEASEIVAYSGMRMDKEETFKYQGTYTIKNRDYTADSTITVIPATIIYYEDSFVEFSSYTKGESDWTMDKTSAWTTENGHTEIQATDRPGTEQIGSDMNNLYGYDGVYTDESQWSMGSYHQITVDATHKGEASFTFAGTAFDVIALSSGTTGTITVKIYEGSTADTEKPLHSYMVDTYYGYQYTDTDEDGDLEWNPTDPSNPNALYQVPVMKVDLEDYGTYHVVISVAYNSFFDHGQNNNGGGSYDFMLDAIRIYDQANDGAGNETIENAYVADGEGWPSYIELRDILIEANTFDSLGKDDEVSGIVFIDGIPALTDDSASGEEGGIFTDPTEGKTAIADYANFGPNNELYLASGQGVAFALELDGQNVEHIHLALKSVGGTANVKVYGVNATDNKTYALGSDTEAASIATATDLYYDITNLRSSKAIVIVSSGDAIASITNIKMTHSKPVQAQGQSEQEMMTQRFRISRDTAALALAAVAPAPVNPFVDVFEGDFYYDSVLWAVGSGITGGVDDTHFAPGQACNRAQVVTFLWRAAGCPEPNTAEHSFVDVEEGTFYYKAMLWAVEQGITSGVDDTHFAPGGTCNRAQIVTFLWRAAGSPEPNVSGHPFTDVQAGSFYEKATMWAVNKGITKGVAPDSFGPAITCTRGQVVTFLYRASVR